MRRVVMMRTIAAGWRISSNWKHGDVTPLHGDLFK